MKLEILKKALEHYVLSADCSDDDRQNVFDAIADCNQLAERYSYRNLWKDTVYIISADSMSQLLNMATYDIYGKLARRFHGEVKFEYYANNVRSMLLDDLTNDTLQLGFDIVCELWADNELAGDHNPDGTFKRTY